MCFFHSSERVTENVIQKTLFYITFVEYHFLSRKCSQKRNFYHVATEQIKVHLQLENKKDWNRFLLRRSEGRKILWRIASSIRPQFSSTTSRDKTPLNWETQQWMMLFHVINECEIRWMRFAGSPYVYLIWQTIFTAKFYPALAENLGSDFSCSWFWLLIQLLYQES